ncbi:MAG TPA: 16S rRNA (adenine(1518)-N(6)/adenine(1519)-N(6))-dimethyltransferase RsmA [Gammaproteobacteria bacterium]|nr:16S rRNA (adenine(1518)-N(6)/adenine(1519)-N(6))-dimethyltransferase RsmA [Gammaproteobacteria bacterium]
MNWHRPRKSLGQHFLVDPIWVERIIDHIHPHATETLLEIGPGRGALTLPLLGRVKQLQIIELDNTLAARWQQQALREPRLVVHHADVMNFDFSPLLSDHRALRIVGNLPYNIASPLILKLLDYGAHIGDLVFMVQKEVADRMTSPPGSRQYGRLSIMVQWLADVESLLTVPPGAFTPPPRVHSSVIRIQPLTEPRFAISNPQTYRKLVLTAFSQRRKTLRNCLKTLITEPMFASAGIDPMLRPEQLSPADFARLEQILSMGNTRNPKEAARE